MGQKKEDGSGQSHHPIGIQFLAPDRDMREEEEGQRHADDRDGADDISCNHRIVSIERKFQMEYVIPFPRQWQ